MAALSLCWLGVAAVRVKQQGEPVADLWQGSRNSLTGLVLQRGK